MEGNAGKNNQLKTERRTKMKFKVVALIVMVFMMSLGLVLGQASAAEILTKEDFIQKVVTREHLIKTADNFIIMFDASNSMDTPYQRGGAETKYQIARKMLKERNEWLPDLGYNAGFYLFTPWTEVVPVGRYDKAAYANAIDSLPAKPKGPTFLPQSLRQLDAVLGKLTGRTVVFLFSDGTYSKVEGMKVPEQYTAELAKKHNVCFYLISYASRGVDNKRLLDMAKANECSRVISFKQFIENPGYTTNALFVVKSTISVETITDRRAIGLKVNNIEFGVDQSNVQSDFYSELDAVGSFMTKNPKAHAVIDGYTDDTGDFEYNMHLSRRRAESVSEYLVYKHNVDPDRLIVGWFGAVNAIAGNDTDEGRQKNRRVEIAIGGLE